MHQRLQQQMQLRLEQQMQQVTSTLAEKTCVNVLRSEVRWNNRKESR